MTKRIASWLQQKLEQALPGELLAQPPALAAEAALAADSIATFSTRIKDAGTAVRHSRRTFSHPRPPECFENRISTADQAADRPAAPPATQTAQQSQSRPPEPPRPQEAASRPAKTLDLQTRFFGNLFFSGASWSSA